MKKLFLLIAILFNIISLMAQNYSREVSDVDVVIINKPEIQQKNSLNFDASKYISIEEYLATHTLDKENSVNAKDNNSTQTQENNNSGRRRQAVSNASIQNNSDIENQDNVLIKRQDMSPEYQDVLGTDLLIHNTGSSPAIDIKEIGGELWLTFSAIISQSTYNSILVYRSTNKGVSWSSVFSIYNTTKPVSYPLISVLTNYVILSYVEGTGFQNSIGVARVELATLNATFKSFTVKDASNTAAYEEVSWGSMVSDKFYYDESATWTYLTYLTFNNLGKMSIQYYFSEDQGNTWSSGYRLLKDSVAQLRYAISIGYTTPKPYTGIDFIWITWKDMQNNINATKIDVYNPPAHSNSIIIPASTFWTADHGTVATYFNKIFITGTIQWLAGSGKTNVKSDLYMTFSSDGGATWGTSDYSWYYWKDVDDKTEIRPVATYGTNGVLGFAWTYDGDLYFRTNSTGNFLQGWNPTIVTDVNSTSTILIAAAIQDSSFHYAYSPAIKGVYYNKTNLAKAITVTVNGYISNAVTGVGIANALVKVADKSATTNSSGYFSITGLNPGYVSADFTADKLSGSKPLNVNFINLSVPGSHPYQISSTGYITQSGNIYVDAGKTYTISYSLSPVLQKGETRVVLNWGFNPRDLDAHLYTPSISGQTYHVHWKTVGSKTSNPFAFLDIDDTSSYGPETITIKQRFPGKYSYYVENYSRKIGASTTKITEASATVSIFQEAVKLASISPIPSDPNTAFDRWHVFDMDGNTGNITVVNKLVAILPGLVSEGIENKKDSYLNSKRVIELDPPLKEKSITAMTYNWSFGDGSTSTIEHPSHTYQNTGVYTVKLVVTDGANYASKIYDNFITITSTLPIINAISPTSGKSGTNITITGIDFGATQGTSTVKIGTTIAAVNSWSNTAITATVPAIAEGIYTVYVITANGTTSSTIQFTVTSLLPTITSFTPTSGGAGATVTIIGTNFTGATAVTIGGTNATSFTVVSATSITAVIGSGATGTISITTPGGTATSSGTFTFVSPPSVVDLVHPKNDTTNLPLNLIFKWNKISTATKYRLNISTVSTFATFVKDTTIADTTFKASGLNVNTKYYWRVLASNIAGEGAFSEIRGFTTGTNTYVKHNNLVATEYSLSQNYPNPFNPTTTIRFGIPVESRVQLEIYNSLGRLVETLIDNEILSAGYYDTKWIAKKIPTGLYFYKIIATDIINPNNKLIQTKKMMLVK